MKTTICAISDLHGYLPNLPPSNLLILAGDYCRNHKDWVWYESKFRKWVANLAKDRKVVAIAGNHDIVFQTRQVNPYSFDWTYLENSSCEFNGLKIWGSPYTPTFGEWAFMKDDDELEAVWDMIPRDINILVTHGPPKYVFDKVFSYNDWTKKEEYENAGSETLLSKTYCLVKSQTRSLKLHCFGHMHDYRNCLNREGIQVNVSYVGENYKPKNLPILLREL